MTARTSAPSLSILAGPEALSELRAHGLRPERVKSFVGASGGPKWLVLHGLDRVLFPWLVAGRSALVQSPSAQVPPPSEAGLGSGASGPLHVLGSSIGSFRAATLATRDPEAALERLCEGYIEQRYSARPSPREVSGGGEKIMADVLGSQGVAPLVEHPWLCLHIVTVRMRHVAALEGEGQKLGLALCALLNTLDRRALGLCLERVVFDARADPGPFAPWRMLPTRHVPLTRDNAFEAIQASASIPAVMAGVRDPRGAPPGIYRDGGVADYHFGLEIDAAEGLTLYPHFYPYLVPGWFDKALPWRRTRGLKRTLLIAPSAAHVAALPGGKIPDRDDFVRMNDADRIAAWRKVVALGARMSDELSELIAKQRIADVAVPL